MKKAGLIGLVVVVIVIGAIAIFLNKQPKLNVSIPTKTNITVSIPLLKNIAQEIGGDEVTVNSIVEGTSCNHHYEPTTGNMKQVANSSMFVKIGMDFDLWVEKIIKNAGDSSLLVIDASQGVSVIEDNEAIEHHDEKFDTVNHKHNDQHEHEHETEHNHNLGNPHYWGNPANLKIVANNILKALIKLNPEKKDYFTANYDQYVAKLDQTVAELLAKVNLLPNKTIVSYSAAFPYFYDFFGFDCIATVESTCEQEVSAKRLATIATITKNQKIKVVVGEETYPNLPRNLTEETGTKLVLLWPATDETGDYLETIKINVEKMVTALK